MGEMIQRRMLDPLLIGGASGVLAVLCFSVGYGTAWAISPDYEFGRNFLSDLGVMEGALAFNLGVMSAGLLIIPFAWSLWHALEKRVLGTLGSIACALAGGFLFLVGVFPEHAEPAGIHYAVSVGFFVLVSAALVLLILPLIRAPMFRSLSGPVSIAILVVSIVLLIPFGAGPLMETIAVLEIIVWGCVVSVQMIRSRSDSSPQPSLEELD